MYRRAKRFEFSTHVALLLLGAAIAAIYWQSDRSGPVKRITTIRVDFSQVLARWRPSHHHVLLFVSPDNSFVEYSMPFYDRLTRAVDSMRQAGAPVSIAAVINRSASYLWQREILRDANVRVDTLLQTSARSIYSVGVPALPSVVVVDSTGRTRGLWIGLQQEEGEREILSMVTEIGAPSS
jgi:hypothetical protein